MLRVDLKVKSTGCTLVCQGEIIGAREADYLFDLLLGEDQGEVILDLTKVTNIDQHGLSVILAAHKILANANRRLSLRRLSTDLIRELQQHHPDLTFDSGQRQAPAR